MSRPIRRSSIDLTSILLVALGIVALAVCAAVALIGSLISLTNLVLPAALLLIGLFALIAYLRSWSAKGIDDRGLTMNAIDASVLRGCVTRRETAAIKIVKLNAMLDDLKARSRKREARELAERLKTLAGYVKSADARIEALYARREVAAGEIETGFCMAGAFFGATAAYLASAFLICARYGIKTSLVVPLLDIGSFRLLALFEEAFVPFLLVLLSTVVAFFGFLVLSWSLFGIRHRKRFAAKIDPDSVNVVSPDFDDEECEEEHKGDDTDNDGARPGSSRVDTVEVALETLGLTRAKLTDESLKTAFHASMAKFHPDKFSHLGDDFRRTADERAKRINAAYELLKIFIAEGCV